MFPFVKNVTFRKKKKKKIFLPQEMDEGLDGGRGGLEFSNQFILFL